MSVNSSLKLVIPARWHPALRHGYLRVRNVGWRRRCNVCGSHLVAFTEHGRPPEPDFLCPVCRSKPPHRLAAYFFDSHPHLFVSGGLLVHIAPEPGLGPRLARMATASGMRYRAGGITGQGKQYLDLLRLPFDPGSVHLLYCCHVLNSLQDDRAAMREVRRVLHPLGVALLQVPAFHRGATTLETDGLDERMRVFGDEGIFRCYTNADYEARLRDAGFVVDCFRAEELPADRVRRLALKQELLHVCRTVPA